MTIPLPPVWANTPEDRMTLSYRFLEHAQGELDKGHRLQASAKVWGAAAQALKANGLKRGWNHDEHVDILAIACQLALEYDRPELNRKVDTAENHRGSFCASVKYPNAIQAAIDSTEELVVELDDIFQAPYRPFQVADDSDAHRLLRLTGRRYAIGKYSAVGFAQHTRRRKRGRRSKWVSQRRDAKGHSEGDGDDANGNPPAPTIRPRGGGPAPAGGPANPTPKPRPPSVKDSNLKPGKGLPKDEGTVANGRGRMSWPRQKKHNPGSQAAKVNIILPN